MTSATVFRGCLELECTPTTEPYGTSNESQRVIGAHWAPTAAATLGVLGVAVDSHPAVVGLRARG
jgi:hypothetical protein